MPAVDKIALYPPNLYPISNIAFVVGVCVKLNVSFESVSATSCVPPEVVDNVIHGLPVPVIGPLSLDNVNTAPAAISEIVNVVPESIVLI